MSYENAAFSWPEYVITLVSVSDIVSASSTNKALYCSQARISLWLGIRPLYGRPASPAAATAVAQPPPGPLPSPK